MERSTCEQSFHITAAGAQHVVAVLEDPEARAALGLTGGLTPVSALLTTLPAMLQRCFTEHGLGTVKDIGDIVVAIWPAQPLQLRVERYGMSEWTRTLTLQCTYRCCEGASYSLTIDGRVRGNDAGQGWQFIEADVTVDGQPTQHYTAKQLWPDGSGAQEGVLRGP